MRRAWGPEDFARETVLQFDSLAIDDHLLGSWWWPVARAAIRHIFTREEKENTVSERDLGPTSDRWSGRFDKIWHSCNQRYSSPALNDIFKNVNNLIMN